MTRKARLLVVTPEILQADRAAGDRRLSEMLACLAETFAIDFAVLIPPPPDRVRYERDLAERGMRLLGYGWRRAQAALLANHYDVVLFEFHWTLPPLASFARGAQPHALLAVDSVDVHFARAASAARIGIGSVADVDETRSTELSAYRAADLTIAVSGPDAELLRREGISNVSIVPIVMPVRPRVKRERAPVLLFVASFAHPPNADGLGWFLDECWSSIRTSVPDARLQVVGANPPSELLRHPHATGVDFLEHVPDLEPVFEAAQISIAPLRFGGGMKGKVAEAIAHGIPLVTTSVGAEGFVADGAMLVADTPDAFSDSVVQLLRDESLRDRLGAGGQFEAERRCSVSAARTGLTPLIAHATTTISRGRSVLQRARFSVSWVAGAAFRRANHLLR